MTTVLVIAFVAIAAVLAAAVFAIAYRRGRGIPGDVPGAPRRPGVQRDVLAAPSAAAGADDEAEPIDPLEARTEVGVDEYNVTRRQFFNRAIYGVFGLFLANFGLAGLSYMWPKLSGGFGSKVNAGPLDSIVTQLIADDGRIVPLFIPSAQAYVVPFAGDPAGSSFEDLPVIAGGVMALWQKCVHLGCRVPECDSSQGFECPCHGSKYNYHGEYESGPAPRNLDRFAVTVTDGGELVIDTSQVIQTARSATKTAEYPQGPSCI
ncbi:MAG: Rieske 2Fe-2S domain-containing protein [Actinobacteria bacterium]|nr:Rieske 2Fe-2S domain-containing protein [Actinomycetota bacterium]